MAPNVVTNDYMPLATTDREEEDERGGYCDPCGGARSKEIDDEQPKRPPQPVKSPDQMDIVMFNAPMYYAEKEDGSLTVEIVRLGKIDEELSIDYYTEDDTARAGSDYRENKGRLVFKADEIAQSVTVQLLQAGAWSITREFKVHITNPQNCLPAYYLKTARVKIIDTDVFPSSKLKQSTESKVALENVSMAYLFFEYLRLVCQIEGVARPTCIIVALDQLKNLYLYFTLLLNIYMVDVVFSSDHEGTKDKLLIPISRGATAVIVGFAMFAPLAILHLWDFRKAEFDVSGKITSFLRRHLLAKYLVYSEGSRLLVPASQMQSALIEDCAQLAVSYVFALEALQVIGKIFVVMQFCLQYTPHSLWGVGSMPVLFLMWMMLRHPVYMTADELKTDQQREVAEFISDSCAAFNIIAHYHQRAQTEEAFWRRLQKLQEATIPSLQIQVNNEYFTRWMGPVFAGFYICIAGQRQLSGEISLGTFLTAITVFGQLTLDFQSIYTNLMSVHGMSTPLRRITKHFNLPADLKQMKTNQRKRGLMTFQASAEIVQGKLKRGEPRDDPPSLDLVPIVLLDVCFHYSWYNPIYKYVNLSVPQGSLVSIQGPGESGKVTILRLLAQSIFPTEGDIAIPTHLRQLYVAQEPFIFDASIWYNLVFGLPHARLSRANRDDDGNDPPSVVKDIMRSMGLHSLIELVERDLAELDAQEQSGAIVDVFPARAAKPGGFNWYDTITYTVKCKIHLARAFIANPEMLVLNRPFHAFANSPEDAKIVMQALEEHGRNRGIAMKSETKKRRRPNTVFFTPENAEQAHLADILWRIDKDAKLIEDAAKDPSIEPAVQRESSQVVPTVSSDEVTAPQSMEMTPSLKAAARKTMEKEDD